MNYKKTNYRKNTFKRKYNISIYKLVKKTNKFFRDKFSPNPFQKICDYGVVGKVCGKAGNKLIAPAINDLSYSTTGLCYDKSKDKPIKGSILYTIFPFLFILITLGIVTLIVSIFSGF